MQRTERRWAPLFAAALVAACTDTSPCEPVVFPGAPSGALFVDAACAAASPDGSASAPFSSIAAAVERAGPGGVVVVGAGEYTVEVVLVPGLKLLGVAADKVIIRPPAGKRGIVAEGTGADVLIQGVTVQGATRVGVASSGPALSLVGVQVKGTTAAKGEPGTGHGVAVVGAGGLRMEACVVSGNSGIGVGAWGSGPVAIIDPLFDGGARSGGASIIDPLFQPASSISGNDGGGVAIIDPLFSTAKADEASSSSLRLEATSVSANKGFGVAVYGGTVNIARTAITGTTAADSGAADGLLLANGADAARQGGAQVGDAVVIADNGRAGLLAAARATVSVAALIRGNAMGGVWAQGAGAAVTLSAKARLAENQLVGAAVTAGARVAADGARVEQTKARKWQDPGGGEPAEIGDGVGVFSGGRATLQKCAFSGNSRAAVLAHHAGVGASGDLELAVSASTFAGGKYGIVVNEGGKGAVKPAQWQQDNTFGADVGMKIDTAGKLKVQVSPCGNGASADACAK